MNLKIVAVILLFAVAVGAALAFTFSQGGVEYRTFPELTSENYGGERVKMKVQVTAIESNFNPTIFTAIDLTPEDDASAPSRGRPLGSGRVIYEGTELPQGFKLNCHATVEGRYDVKRGAFVATHIQTQCPSKYEGQEIPPPPVLPAP